MKKRHTLLLIIGALLLSSCGSIDTADSTVDVVADITQTSITTENTQASDSSVSEKDNSSVSESISQLEIESSAEVSDEQIDGALYITYFTSGCQDEGEKQTITDKERLDKINDWLEKVKPELEQYYVDYEKLSYSGGGAITVCTQPEATDDIYFTDDFWQLDLSYITISEERMAELIDSGYWFANFSYDLHNNYLLPDEYFEEIYELITGEEITVESLVSAESNT